MALPFFLLNDSSVVAAATSAVQHSTSCQSRQMKMSSSQKDDGSNHGRQVRTQHRTTSTLIRTMGRTLGSYTLFINWLFGFVDSKASEIKLITNL